MARTASMTAADAEKELGPRGHITVTVDNRRTVRKWLNAQGFPSLFSGGLSMRELALAYNDTSGRALEQLKRKLDEAGEGADETAEDLQLGDAVTSQRHSDVTASQAGKDEAGNAAKGAKVGASLMDAIANTTKRAGEQIGATASEGATRAPAQARQGDDMSRVIAAVTAAMQAMGPNGTDEDTVRRIAREVLHGEGVLKSQVGDVIGRIVAEIEGNVRRIEETMVRNSVRIELKAGDTVRDVEGIHHPQFAKLLKAAASRQADGFHPNIWIAGPAGSGKTYAAKMVAKAMEAEFHYNGALSMPHELLGFIDAGGTYHETPFHLAYTSTAVYLFDEVDGSDNSALLALNAALANGRASFPKGQAERHKDSVIIATANTWGLGATADYVGRAKIDAAFLSRFPVRINWDYDADMEAQICGNAQWAKRVQKARGKARSAGIKVLIDPRASIAGAGLIAAGFTPDEAAGMTYLANLTPEQRQMIEA